MKITFNTGRTYTAEGQIITAVYDADARSIRFFDHSRLIVGTVEKLDRPFASREPHGPLLARVLMEHYDRGAYHMDCGPTLEREATVLPLCC